MVTPQKETTREPRKEYLIESHPLSIGEQGDLPGPWCLPLPPPPEDAHD